jgi:hypothetical protein
VQQGQVTTSLGIKNILFTPINFIRTFIQIHGDILLIIKIYKIYILSILGILITILLLNFKRVIQYIKSLKSLSLKKIKSSITISNPLIIAILLHFSFAFYSEGNAEFMVMLPLLLIIWFSQSNLLHFQLLKGLTIFIAIWNTLFFIIPSQQYDFKGIALISKEIQTISQSKKKPVKFITNNNVLFSNYLEYKNLTTLYEKMNFKIQSIEEFNDGLHVDTSKDIILTDAIDNIASTDRRSVISKVENQNWLFNPKYHYRKLAILQPNSAQKIKITELY